MYVTLNGYNTNAASFYSTSEVKTGDFVKISSNSTVSACRAGEVPCGICIGRDKENACVQLQGYAAVNYSGAIPPYGRIKILADGKGGFTVGEAGAEVLLISYNSELMTAEVIF